MPKTAEAKQATQSMKMKAPKKGSVLFESDDPNGMFSAVYLTRKGAEAQLSITDLDKVKVIEITVKAVE